MQQDESTALHNAAREGHKETVLALLQAGADVHAKDKVRGGLLSVMSRRLASFVTLSTFVLFVTLSTFVLFHCLTFQNIYVFGLGCRVKIWNFEFRVGYTHIYAYFICFFSLLLSLSIDIHIVDCWIAEFWLGGTYMYIYRV
jgi:hypothetical protein